MTKWNRSRKRWTGSKVGGPPSEIAGRVPDGDVGRDPPEHMGPAKATVWAVDVVVVVSVGMVPAVVGHPADWPALGGTAAEGSQHVLEPPGSSREVAMRQEPVVSQADAHAGCQPVENEADRQGLPGEAAGNKRQENTTVKPRDPEKRRPRDAVRIMSLRGGCSHWGAPSRGRACGGSAAWRRPLKNVSGG